MAGDLELLDTAYLLFALVDSKDREGTFIEMGYAAGRKVPVVGLFALPENEEDWTNGSFSESLCTFKGYYHTTDPFAAVAPYAVNLIVLCLATRTLVTHTGERVVRAYQHSLWAVEQYRLKMLQA